MIYAPISISPKKELKMEATSLLMLVQQFKSLIDNNTQDVEQFFHVSWLKQIPAVDVSLIGEIVEIFHLYLKQRPVILFSSWIEHIIDFLIGNTLTLLDNENFVANLLVVLRELCNRLNEFPKIESIVLELVSRILNKEIKSEQVIREAIEMLLIIFKFKKVENENEFSASIVKLLSSTGDLVYRLTVCLKVMSYVSRSYVPEIPDIYEIILLGAKKISTVENPDVCIKAVGQMYKYCKETSLLQKLCFLVAENATIHSTFLKEPELKSDVVLILTRMANCLFKTTPWSGNLTEELTNVPIQDSYFKFLLYYLEFGFDAKIRDKNFIMKEITTVCSTDAIPTNPAVQKSLFLLYSSYLTNDTSPISEKLSGLLIKSLQLKSDVHNYITYHESQLVWILYRGTKSLKIKTLKLWIKHFPNYKVIADCIVKIGAENCFLEIMPNLSCEGAKILNIVRVMSTSENFDAVLRSSIKNQEDPKITESLLKFGPSCAENEAEAIFLSGKLIKILLKNEVHEDTKHLIYLYCFSTMLKFKESREVVEALSSVEFVRHLLKSLEFEATIETSITFLRQLIVIQGAHKLRYQKKINLNNCSQYIRKYPRLIPKLLKLLEPIVLSKNCILKFPDVPYVLYSDLLLLINSAAIGTMALDLVLHFMNHEPLLLTSSLNTTFIICESNKHHLSRQFLLYVQEWRSKVIHHKYIILPERELQKIFKYFDIKYNSV